ncbi:MAG: hypothetical protein WEB33_04910 [Bacteroidota bacterium]
MKVFGVIFIGMLALVGCSRSGSEVPPGNLTQEEARVAGVQWSYPETWTRDSGRPMRVVTYAVPAAEGDPEPGECGVFYFGEQQGGDIDGNIQRWGAQFEGATQAEKTAIKVNGLNVTTVKIEGTFLAPGGPMMQSQGKKDNYRLLGAIVEAPGGMVFFKCTGPAKTIESGQAQFLAMINTVQAQQ